jgi:hypothetical protein
MSLNLKPENSFDAMRRHFDAAVNQMCKNGQHQYKSAPGVSGGVCLICGALAPNGATVSDDEDTVVIEIKTGVIKP